VHIRSVVRVPEILLKRSRQPKEALTPAAVEGQHGQLGVLPDTAVKVLSKRVRDQLHLKRFIAY
jgi:hypothetical protein